MAHGPTNRDHNKADQGSDDDDIAKYGHGSEEKAALPGAFALECREDERAESFRA